MYSGIYTSNVFEYMIIEAASHIAKEGRARRFEKQAGITLDFNVGIDTSFYSKDWHMSAPCCEIVCCDFQPEDPSTS